MGTQTPRVGMRPFTAVLLRATLVALLVATGIGPSAPLRAQTPADRTNHIRNSSVETDTKGWNKYTNDDTLKVDYSRDTQLGFDGTASLRQDIAISDDIGKDAAAAWVYEIRINPKWWGKPVSASMEAWTSDVALEPTIVVQFWQSDKLIHAYTEESRATSGSATGAWVRHELSGVDVLEGTTEIRFICRARVLTKGTTGTVWYDAVVLEQAGVAGPYLPGGESTPAGNAASPVASPVSQGSPPATVLVVLSPTATSTPLPTATTVPPTATATVPPTATMTPAATGTSTPAPTATSPPSPSPTRTPEPTHTPAPTATRTPIPTATQTTKATVTQTPRPTATQSPTATSTHRPTATKTPQPTATNTPRPTATRTPIPTVTQTPVPTATRTATASIHRFPRLRVRRLRLRRTPQFQRRPPLPQNRNVD